MKPFIEGEIERVSRLIKALNLMQTRIGILRGIDPANSRLIHKMRKLAEKDYQEYETAKGEILKAWESEEKTGIGNNNVVSIAESFAWHPHEIVQII